MTSDAKIGLLLGLVFIFLIAFIINGLPSFNNNTNSSELTANMVHAQNTSPGLAAKERRVSRQVSRQNIRFTTALPKSTTVAGAVTKTKPVIAAWALPIAKKNDADNLRTGRGSKFYVVGEGDSLAHIAKKVYGPAEGNRKATITRIFNANRKLLKSPDRVYPGQKLLMPLLSGPAGPENKVKSIGSVVEAWGRRKTKQAGVYVVKAGDSLWRIAERKLGNGARYDEIVQLNTNIISDEEALVVGMRLKLPGR